MKNLLSDQIFRKSCERLESSEQSDSNILKLWAITLLHYWRPLLCTKVK
jgi:hypothetical protein